MRLSFDDEESFKEAIESLRFNRSDPNTRQQMGSSDSMPLEDYEPERNEDYDDIAPSNPIPLRRVGSSGSLSIQETRFTRRNVDIQVCFNNPPSNPEFIGTSANGY